jgi:2,5-furandicarboxylate decarboxylase 1
MNKPLGIAIAVGTDPLTFFTAGIPAPEGVDKFHIAGGLAQAPIELVKCHSVDVEVPAAAEFMLEGELIPGRREPEGPFGASTGLYSSCDNPAAQIKLISHRHNPIYHAFITFGPEEDVLLGLPWDADTFLQLKRTLPFVQKVHFDGLSGLVMVQIVKESEEGVREVIERLFSNPMVKVVVVTDADIDIEEPNEVAWALSRVCFDKDLIVKSDQPGSPLDPSAVGPETPAVEFFPMITKIGIDATKPLTELERFERIDVPAKVKEKVWGMLQGILS